MVHSGHCEVGAEIVRAARLEESYYASVYRLLVYVYAINGWHSCFIVRSYLLAIHKGDTTLPLSFVIAIDTTAWYEHARFISKQWGDEPK